MDAASIPALTKLAPGWVAAVVPGGLLFAADHATVDVEHELPEGRAAEVLAALGGCLDDEIGLAKLLGTERAEAAELVGELDRLGAIAPTPPAALPGTVPLARAVLAALEGVRAGSHIYTAAELLVLPDRLDGRALRRLLRAFIAGLESHPRLRAYASLAVSAEPLVIGDEPPAELLERAAGAAAGLEGGTAHVIALADCSVQTLPAGELDELGAREVHRLGTVPHVDFPAPRTGRASFYLCMARHAHPNLRHPGRRHSFASGMADSREQALLIARAEAAERYAGGDLSGHELRRAAADELDGPHLSPDSLFRYNERQYAERWSGERYDAGEARLWVAGERGDGERCWVAAQNVFYPFTDPRLATRLPPVTSSGVAAHTSPAEARERALRELIERDAFMWTWVQRVSRERVDRDSLPSETAARAAELERAGFSVDFVNLTLETKPVVLCGVRNELHLSISAACREEPADAAARALLEASAVLWFAEPGAPLAPEDVVGPEDHLRIYADPSIRGHADFLFASGEAIDVREVRADDAPVERAVERIGKPVFIDLSCPGSRPFTVVRALVPGIVPIAFGYDREPLGVPRLAEPKQLADGRSLGRADIPGADAPILPHPFP